MTQDFDGLTAIVTGGASGIGAAIARRLLDGGAHVAVLDLSIDSADPDTFAVQADVGDDSSVRSAVEAVVSRFGGIDILINNAGMVSMSMEGSSGGAFVELDDEAWDRDLAMNLDTAYNVTRRVLPGMVERGWGRIVMVSSVTGPLVTYPGLTAYSAAKAGMDGLMRGVAIEVAARGVTANSVQPGFVATGSQTPEEHEIGLHTPIGRSGTAEEIGEVIAFLASDRARYVTGQTVVVDGGNVIQEAKGP